MPDVGVWLMDCQQLTKRSPLLKTTLTDYCKFKDTYPH